MVTESWQAQELPRRPLGSLSDDDIYVIGSGLAISWTRKVYNIQLRSNVLFVNLSVSGVNQHADRFEWVIAQFSKIARCSLVPSFQQTLFKRTRLLAFDL